MIWISIALFFGLLAMGVPVVFVLLTLSIFFVVLDPGILPVVHAQRIVVGTQSFPLLAVPLFVLVGELANVSGLSERAMRFASLVTRSMHGGLAQANIVISTLMSGMSGSAIGDAAMNGKIIVPQMRSKGYPGGFAAAVTAASGLIAPLIPPGIGMILMGFICDISIGRLFMGGIVPGLMLAGVLMIVTRHISIRRGFEPPLAAAPLAEILTSAIAAIPALLLPVLIIVGIRGGVFTPSEAAAVAVVYVTVLCAIYRQAGISEYYTALKSSAITTSIIMIVLAASAGFGWILTFEQVPQSVGRALLDITGSPFALLLIIAGLLVICGMFIEGTPLILIFGPMFLPAAETLGIDPVHYGVFFVFIVTLGGITPPVGTIMFATCAVTETSIPEFARAVLPYIAGAVCIAIALAAFPPLITFLAYL